MGLIASAGHRSCHRSRRTGAGGTARGAGPPLRRHRRGASRPTGGADRAGALREGTGRLRPAGEGQRRDGRARVVLVPLARCRHNYVTLPQGAVRASGPAASGHRQASDAVAVRDSGGRRVQPGGVADRGRERAGDAVLQGDGRADPARKAPLSARGYGAAQPRRRLTRASGCRPTSSADGEPLPSLSRCRQALAVVESGGRRRPDPAAVHSEEVDGLTEQRHPLWCDTRWCTADADPPGAHISAPTTIPLDERSFETAVVRLTQRVPVPSWPNPLPIVQIEVYDGLDETEGGLRYVQVLRIGWARAFAAVLRSTARLVELDPAQEF